MEGSKWVLECTGLSSNVFYQLSNLISLIVTVIQFTGQSYGKKQLYNEDYLHFRETEACAV